MHRAVDHDSGQPLFVRRENAFGPLDIGDSAKTFVMDDQVIAIGPIGILIEGDFDVSIRPTLLDVSHLDVEPALPSLP